MEKEAPDLFEILARVGIPWHASGNKGITISPDKLYPVIERDLERNAVHRIRWNNDDRGVVPVGRKYSVMRWYKAASLWNEILRRKELEYWFQLEPGKVLSKYLCFTSFCLMLTLHTKSLTTGEYYTAGVLSQVEGEYVVVTVSIVSFYSLS
ncbi:hypothetical protein F4782DRAFT_90698 [Xylaria castorea]|nr:hypothetical protein F4782DRAFT_90698 [Xylaria castorea]